MKTFLITGGTGLVGKALAQHLITQGNEVRILTRNPIAEGDFFWNPDKGQLDESSLTNVNVLVLLAGEGIADQRWTAERKEKIVSSRVNGTNLLFNIVREKKIPIETVIAASGIGYYGFRNDGHVHEETEVAANDFIGETVRIWEKGTSQFRSLGVRTVQLRIGVVLEKSGGALKKMLQVPVLSPLGSGTQYLPFIHVIDLIRLMTFAAEQTNMNGVYNAVATQKINNREFTKVLAKNAGKPFLPIGVPSVLLHLVLGEIAKIVLTGNAVSNQKTLASGFTFIYDEAETALAQIFNR